ncbi:uncharacterized protein DNG_04128 [Cephalotrichum gorgonifer]|uniref:Uncharacterized protein n=1 Tax=Cephalotrichum gorgonifer TaxID=2041049 RepID=A0AAE8SU96_9PEZI|nr:uncharacterized protein DNG_04128 [Cephalotrichum gorgonifer]
MRWTTSIAAALLAAGASASGVVAIERGVVPLSSADVLERRYLDVSSGHHLVRRQRPQFESTVTLNQDGTIDMEAWDTETETACQDALKRLQIASNPSGVCICYNLPSLDTASGVFEADLRVYRFNEPSGAFQGISAENIRVGLMYNGASVSPITAEDMQARNVAGTTRKRQNAAGATDDQASATPDLPLLQQYLLVGQIAEDRMGDQMTMAELEALVMPVLTLTADNTAGQAVSTNVSSNEAVFVTGVFSREVVMSDFARASAAVDLRVEQLANRTVAFVLPGVQLMVYPIGLIITGSWLVIGVTAYGIGTYDRIRYAASYRRRTARAMDKGRQI